MRETGNFRQLDAAFSNPKDLLGATVLFDICLAKFSVQIYTFNECLVHELLDLDPNYQVVGDD